ncbi:MAG: amidase [Acidimicrobiia bacterium]|nr:amidase [Acidimicrobiia bacterium]
MDFRRTTVAALVAQVRSGELSATELVTHAIDRIAALDGQINAFSQHDPERSLAAAALIDRRLQAGEDVGPLAGIPIGVKDLEDAEGYVTTFGSDLHVADPPADRNSVLVERLTAAGCVVVGKTNTPEFGFKGVTDNVPFGATTNPWDPSRTPGGSSGGSAAAIAAGMVPLATGSDGGGSIRIPSALCGLSGIKTSQGRVPLGDPAPSGTGLLSVRGPMTRTIRDAALALDASVGPHPLDVFALPAPQQAWAPQLDGDVLPPRIAYSPTMGYATVDREVAAVVEAAVRQLEAAGTEVVEVPMVFESDPVMAWVHIWTTSRARTQGRLKGTPEWERIDPELRDQIEMGLRITGVQYAEAIDACHLINAQLEAAMQEAPLLVCPTLAGQAPVLGRPGTIDGVESPTWVSFTPFLNLSRNPGGSVCAGFTGSGLPVGLQVIGRQRDDIGVLRCLAAFEDVLGIDRLTPVV